MASTVITYLLWFFFGWAGLHHLYLHRLNQAVVWFATFGGCGLGWVRDFRKIPDYIKWCNGDQVEQARHARRCQNPPRTGCSWFRFLGMVVMGFISATVLSSAAPDYNEELLWLSPMTYNLYRFSYLALLVLGNGLGIVIVANIGELQCDKYYPFASSAVIIPCVMCSNYPILFLAIFATVLVVWYKGLKWRPLVQVESPSAKRKRLCRFVFRYWVACSVWLAVLGSSIYCNATISYDNDNIPVRDILNNFFESKAWRKIEESAYHLCRINWPAGLSQAWSIAMHLFDFFEVNTLRVLGFPRGHIQEDIIKLCRKLSAENQPDSIMSKAEKRAAYTKCVTNSHACSLLLSINMKKAKKGKVTVLHTYSFKCIQEDFKI